MDKTNKYKKIIHDAGHYFDGYEIDLVGKMSIIVSLLKNSFPDWVFCGFYRVVKEDLLEIGPYQGNIIPCAQIDFSRGVCGKSASTNETIIVNNVKDFTGYISCDDVTVSEIVVPVTANNRLIAVLDIDGKDECQFDATDQEYLESIVKFLL